MIKKPKRGWEGEEKYLMPPVEGRIPAKIPSHQLKPEGGAVFLGFPSNFYICFKN